MRRIPGTILILSLLASPAWPEPIRVTGRFIQLEAPGARVELRQVPQGSTGELGPSPVTARPTADGFFELMAPGPGLYRLTAQAEGFLLSEVIPVLEETAVPVRMPSAAPGARRSASPMAVEIRKGRVLDFITQAPLAGALVWQAGLDAGDDVPWTWTAADGSFRLAVRGPDPAVGAAAAGYVPLSGSSLGSGGSSNLMLRPAVTLAGQVVDPEGRPVAGASVTTYPTDFDWIFPEAKATRAGAEGRFLLRGLTPERACRLFVQAEGFVPAWHETARGKPGHGAPPVRIVLSPGAVFTGRIVDPAGRSRERISLCPRPPTGWREPELRCLPR